MKTIVLFLSIAALAVAQDHTSPATDSPKSAAKAAAADTAPAIPKGAVEIEPNLFRYTDAHGKVWLARRTPFGISTWEDKPAPVVVQPDNAPPPHATDLGDSVRFQKKSPFGESTWTKKKSDLTDEEKDWLASSSDPHPAAQTKAAQPAPDAAEKR